MLTIGQPSPGYDLSNGSNILRFTASLVPVNKHIKAGEFYAIARFLLIITKKLTNAIWGIRRIPSINSG